MRTVQYVVGFKSTCRRSPCIADVAHLEEYIESRFIQLARLTSTLGERSWEPLMSL